MATAMRSSDFRSAVEPLINSIFDGVYDIRKDEWKQFMTQESGTPRAYHEEPVLFGMGAAPEMPDGEAVTYQSGGELFTKRYVYKQFGLAYAMSKILVEDGDHIRLGSIMAKHLANAFIETKETRAANVLNRAATSGYNGGDGVVLASASHPISGGVLSNVTTAAALSQTSLEQALIDVRNQKDNNGKRIRLEAKKLIVPVALQFQAETLVNTTLRPGTANNDINAIRSMGLLPEGVAVVSRMTSSTAWLLKTNTMNGLKMMVRRALEKSMEGDFETDSMRYKATERYIEGWTDWRDIQYNAGA